MPLEKYYPLLWLSALIGLIILCVLAATTSPILETLNLEGFEGKERTLGFITVLEGGDGRYLVGRMFTGEKVWVCCVGCDKPLVVGEVVSVHGVVRGGELLVDRVHTHQHPWTSYYLSTFGLIAFLTLFFREWRISRRGFVPRWGGGVA
ncbi:MAG: hypothetical protein DRO11_02815 [Methanobacteriota archaeon]|nr:MAG: hypothetical protein DRO11_02815 [Euryarchaeota archaeon]